MQFDRIFFNDLKKIQVQDLFYHKYFIFLCHKSIFFAGRGASDQAFPRGAWEREKTPSERPTHH